MRGLVVKVKVYLSKGELVKLICRIYNCGFLYCDKYKIGFDPINNRYQIMLIKDGEELRITLATRGILNLPTIREQLDKYITTKE